MTDKVIKRSVLHKARVFELQSVDYQDQAGKITNFSVIAHPGGVVILPVHPDGSITLVRQWRRVIEKTILELPAGTLERGEDPLACAKRELAEEGRLAATEWHALGPIATAPGFCDEILHGFVARGFSEGTGELDDDEELMAERVSRADFERMVKSGEIIDAKTLALYYRAQSQGLLDEKRS